MRYYSASKKTHYILHGLASLMCLLMSHSLFAKDYIINVLESWQTPQQKVEVEVFLTNLYQPLGITPKVVYYPSQRGLSLVSQGKLDAETSRYPMVANKYPNLIKIPEPIGEFDSTVFCLDASACQNYGRMTIVLKSGFESGLLYCEKNHLDCNKQQNFSTLTKVLKSGWGAVALLQTQFAHEALCQLDEQYLFYKVVPELRSFSYHYVHKSHQDLVDDLDASIKAFKSSLAYESIAQGWQIKLKTCGKKLIEITT